MAPAGRSVAMPSPRKYAFPNAPMIRSIRMLRWSGPGSFRAYAAGDEIWSCRFLPTPLSGTLTSIPTPLSSEGSPMPEEHEQLRCIDDAAAQDHFARSVCGSRGISLHILDTDGARTLEKHACRERLGFQREVWSPERGPKIGDRRAAAHAIPHGRLQPAKAFLLLPIVVRGERVTGAGAGFEECVAETVRIAVEPRRERTIGSPIGICSALPGLLPAEIGKHVGIRPVGEPGCGPAVIVAAVTAHVSHCVDRGRSADDFPARALDRAPAQRCLRLGEIHPVVHAVYQQPRPAERDVYEWVAVPSAGFEQQDLGVGILRQPAGQRAARRARPEDDVIKLIPRHGSRLSEPVMRDG